MKLSIHKRSYKKTQSTLRYNWTRQILCAPYLSFNLNLSWMTLKINVDV